VHKCNWLSNSSVVNGRFIPSCMGRGGVLGCRVTLDVRIHPSLPLPRDLLPDASRHKRVVWPSVANGQEPKINGLCSGPKKAVESNPRVICPKIKNGKVLLCAAVHVLRLVRMMPLSGKSLHARHTRNGGST
jgi:hypothetical protein